MSSSIGTRVVVEQSSLENRPRGVWYTPSVVYMSFVGFFAYFSLSMFCTFFFVVVVHLTQQMHFVGAWVSFDPCICCTCCVFAAFGCFLLYFVPINYIHLRLVVFCYIVPGRCFMLSLLLISLFFWWSHFCFVLCFLDTWYQSILFGRC